MASSHSWAFRAGFRRNAFGWSGTRKAIERLNEAVAEIERMARADPALAGEGAVLLLERLSPAVRGIDSSSGALGTATARVVEKMVPLIVAAPVPRHQREKWLERLIDAIQEDDPPYIESLGEHWGAVCADPALASHWADQLLPLVQHAMADRRRGICAYSSCGTLCYSALLHAGRFDDLLAVLALDPKPYWHDQQWAAKAMAARGDVDGAVNLMEGLRSRYASDTALSTVAEQLLLDAGRVDEAYARYAIQATSANTNIANYRALTKRYPSIEPSRILGDLIASTPGPPRGRQCTDRAAARRPWGIDPPGTAVPWARGRTIDHLTGEVFPASLLQEVCEAQQSPPRPGDILLVRTGWLHHYFSIRTDEQRRRFSTKVRASGLVQSHDSLRWLWDHKFSVIAFDNVGVEVLPAVADSAFVIEDAQGRRPGSGLMHPFMIGLMGFVLGELWDLEKPAQDCAADGIYECLVVAKALNLVGGVGSPANATAIK